MIKKISLIIASVSFAIGASVCIGLSTRNQSLMAKADSLSVGYYIVGDFNGWNTEAGGGALPLTDDTGNVSDQYYYKGFVFDNSSEETGNSTFFKLIHVKEENEQITIDWYKTTSKPSYPTNTYIDSWYVGEGNDYGNVGLYIGAGRTEVLDIYFNVSNGNCALDYHTMSVTIGGTTVAMTKNTGSNDPEFKAVVNGVAVGDSVSIESVGTNLPLDPKNEAGNNLTAEKYVKAVGGTRTIYYNAYTGVTYLDGYTSDASAFAAGFLEDTIDIGTNTCANPDEIIKEGETSIWAYYSGIYNQFSEYEKGIFQSAIDSVISNKVFHGELEEAAARYVHLKNKFAGLADFSGIVIPTGSLFANETIASKEMNLGLSIAIVTGLSAAVIAGYFFLRRRKED